MRAPDTIMIDGRAYSWRQLCELRRQQVDTWTVNRPAQPALFALQKDCRPAAERKAAGRYLEPSLWDSRPA